MMSLCGQSAQKFPWLESKFVKIKEGQKKCSLTPSNARKKAQGDFSYAFWGSKMNEKNHVCGGILLFSKRRKRIVRAILETFSTSPSLFNRLLFAISLTLILVYQRSVVIVPPIFSGVFVPFSDQSLSSFFGKIIISDHHTKI